MPRWPAGGSSGSPTVRPVLGWQGLSIVGYHCRKSMTFWPFMAPDPQNWVGCPKKQLLLRPGSGPVETRKDRKMVLGFMALPTQAVQHLPDPASAVKSGHYPNACVWHAIMRGHYQLKREH